MNRYQKYFIRFIYILIDIVFICFAIFLACKLRFTTIPFDVSFNNVFFHEQNPFRFVITLWVMSTVLLCYSKNLYQTRREVQEIYEIAALVKCVLLSALIMIVALYTLKVEQFPRSIVFVGTLLIFIFLTTWRILKRIFVGHIVARGYNNFNVLIVGAGRVGIALAEEIKKTPDMGLKIVGFLDDFKTTDPQSKDIKILGKMADFSKVAQREFINEMFVTIHNDSEVFLKLLEQAKELGVAVKVVPQGFELMSGECSRYNIGIIPVWEYCAQIPLRKQIGKRLFDFISSLAAIILLLPFFLIIAVLIKLDSQGPVFYVSRRYGKSGMVFNMYKFRSMFIDADQRLAELKSKNEVDGPIFKIRNDPRVTRVGRFLRKYSLDELPQFLNVFSGQMSLVGPRPLPIEQVEREDLKQLKRLEVRPGITGLWQIKGRSDLSFKRLVRWDVWYINNWSFWLDLTILSRTIPAVFKGKGAY